jgi:acid phosphatase type 7
MPLHRLVAAVLLCVGLLAGSADAQVSRGPYLQTGSDTQVTFRWRTSTATNSRVAYGASPTTLTSHVDSATVTTEHEVVVTGLTANTTYYYSVGSTTAVQAGADANHFVLTAPTPGTSKPTRIWVIGDAGTGSSSQTAVRDAYYSFTGTRHTDLWLQLGDNAYSSGTDSEYQSKMFDVYSTMLKKSVVFPTRGNHESATDGSGNVVYYNIFTLPTAAQAGGIASGTEAYYSFDYGNIHFICLDSFGTSRSSTGAMANWLRNDLANNTKAWTIAYWHHPPYTKGSHNSDTESQLIEMRQNINPILEDGGVDLVLSGHSHSYERSKFIDSHYGLSSTFSDATHVVQAGSGQGAGAYAKESVTPEAHSGTVYAVAGSSGQTSGGTLNHPAHYVSLNNLGSLVLDIDGTRLDATFLRETGAANDSFTIIKSAPTSPPAAPTSLSATAGSSQVTLAWAASAGATSYIVKRATVAGGPYAAIATGVTATSYVDSDVTNGTTYYYVVSAMNAAGESANSNQASATPQGGSPPAAPTNLVATTAGKTKIALTWTDNATNETGFKIEMATSATGPFTQIATVGANTTSYTSTGLSRHTTYYYRVRAYGSGGDSTYSNVASATTN